MASSQYVSKMWVDLQKANRLPKGQVLSSCEEELQELMRQIDIMVQNRKMDWEKEKQVLKARVDVREQEFMIQKTTLEQKHQEIGQLRSNIETMETGQREKSHDYERQLSGLRSQVGSIKKEYEKLQRRYRHMKERDKSKQTASDFDDNSAEVRRLTAKVEEFRQRTREWEQQKRTYEKQLESLESQKLTLVEKCEFIQTQSTSYQAQLDKRKDMLNSTEFAMKAHISQLEGQLERSRDTVNSQETQISRLKSAVEGYMTSQRQILEEKEIVEQELTKCQQKVKGLEAELQKAQSLARSRSEVLNQSQEEMGKMKKTIIKLEEELRQRNNVIRSMEDINRNDQSSQCKRLQVEIQSLKSDLRTSKRSDKTSQEELSRTRDHLDGARQECGHLSAELATKISEIRSLEKNDLRNYRGEISRLKRQLAQRQEILSSEIESVKSENNTLKEELSSKNKSIAKLSENLSTMETQTRDHDDNFERKLAELHVSNAQLEALRLENRHLRRTTISNMTCGYDKENSMSDVDIVDAEKHLRELQTAYTTSVSSLEQQNEKLQHDISALRRQLRDIEKSTHTTIQTALEESERKLDKLKLEEEKKVNDVKKAADRKAQALKDKLDATVVEYETEIENLQSELSLMEGELENKSQSCTRLGMENEVMTTFVDGVDHIVQCPPKREESVLSNTENSIPSRPISTISNQYHCDNDDEDEDFLVDSADVATANFIAEQRQRTAELEKKLDMHIHGLKVDTEATVRKYTGR